MFPCSDPYITALNQCGCGVPDGQDKGLLEWDSSVRDSKLVGFADVAPEYWRDCLVLPVLFSQALEQATLENGLDVAVEVGPHPNLKAPASTTISTCTAEEVPHTGCLQRGSDDVAIFAAALGYIWERFAAVKPLDATAFVEAVHGASPTDMSKLVPAYAWDHTQVLWAGPRATKINFNSYTLTDISPAFFEKARDKFSMHLDRMEFDASIVGVPVKRTFAMAFTSATALLSVAANLVTHGIVGDAPAGSSMLLFDPPIFCLGAIVRAAEEHKILILPPRYVAELKFNPQLRFQEPTEICKTDNHGWLPGFDSIRANPKLPKTINTYVKRQLSSFTAPMSEAAAGGLSVVFTDSTEWSTITQLSVMTVASSMSARVFMGKDLCDGFVIKKGTRVGTR
ncbi:hypothetical protein MCOR20_003177 [Pyricularia oryzae]|nr:hypothetical protein MCOR20_003177 [Pyricularia oryzae]